MSDLITKEVIPYNLVHDINFAIQCLVRVTDEFENVDQNRVYADIQSQLWTLIHVHHILLNEYTDDEHMNPLDPRKPRIVLKQISVLSKLSEDLISRHFGKLQKSKQTQLIAEGYLELLEEFIYDKGL
jgi:hypothetical protein